MPLSIYEAKEKYSESLFALQGVVSVGIGKDAHGNLAIIVGLDKSRPKTESQIPVTLEDFPVVIQVIGSIKAR